MQKVVNLYSKYAEPVDDSDGLSSAIVSDHSYQSIYYDVQTADSPRRATPRCN